MQQIVKKKKITIATSGALRLKGGIRGPIDIPYWEDIATIGRMIMAGYKLYEHLDNGEKVLLDVHNYNKENGNNNLRAKIVNIKSAAEIAKKNNAIKSQKTTATMSVGSYVPKTDNYSIR